VLKRGTKIRLFPPLKDACLGYAGPADWKGPVLAHQSHLISTAIITAQIKG